MSMHEFEDLVEMSVRCLAKAAVAEQQDLRSLFWNLYQFQQQWDTGFTQLRVLDILLEHKFVYRFELQQHPDYKRYQDTFSTLNEFAFINQKPDQQWHESDNPIAGFYQQPYLYCECGSLLWQRFVDSGKLSGADAIAPVAMDIVVLAETVIVAAQQQNDPALISMWYTALGVYVFSFYSEQQQAALKSSASMQVIRHAVEASKALQEDAGYGLLKQPTKRQIKQYPYMLWWFQPAKRKRWFWRS